jgi:hypothetical protein
VKGKEPLSMLDDKARVSIFVMAESEDDMDPCKAFFDNKRLVNDVIDDSIAGIVPVNLLFDKVSFDKFVSKDKVDGIVPVSLFDHSSRSAPLKLQRLMELFLLAYYSKK